MCKSHTSLRRQRRGRGDACARNDGFSAELAARCGRDSDLRIDFSAPELLPPLPSDAAEHTYRFAQEAIANIVRHA